MGAIEYGPLTAQVLSDILREFPPDAQIVLYNDEYADYGFATAVKSVLLTTRSEWQFRTEKLDETYDMDDVSADYYVAILEG